MIDSYTDEDKHKLSVDSNNNVVVKREQASELVASPFLKFCKICGHSVTERYGWNWEFLEPQKLHECKESKAERLKHLNRVNV